MMTDAEILKRLKQMENQISELVETMQIAQAQQLILRIIEEVKGNEKLSVSNDTHDHAPEWEPGANIY